MFLGMIKVLCSLKYEKCWYYTREISTPEEVSEELSHITSLTNPFSSWTEQVPRLSHREKTLTVGVSSLVLPQCLEEKTMNKMQSRVQSGLLSLGTQKLIEEDARQGTALLWQCTEELPSLLGSREVLSLQEWLTPYTHEKSTRTVLEYK